MPCLYCGRIQDDPARGASPWAVGVRAGEQVLVCPDCQQAHDLGAELDACGRCGSVRLRRQLGMTVCRACGWQSDADEWAP